MMGYSRADIKRQANTTAAGVPIAVPVTCKKERRVPDVSLYLTRLLSRMRRSKSIRVERERESSDLKSERKWEKRKLLTRSKPSLIGIDGYRETASAEPRTTSAE